MVMTRGVHPDMIAALAAGGYHTAVLVYVDWPGGAVRVHSGIGTLDWDGHDWIGIGVHGMGGRISVPGDDMGIASTEGQASLGGLPEDIDAIYAAESRGVVVEVWCGLTTARAGTVLLAPPVLGWAGYIDGMGDEEAADGVDRRRIVAARLASRASQRLTASAYHTDEDQQAAYPGDTAGRWLRAARQRMQAAVVKF